MPFFWPKTAINDIDFIIAEDSRLVLQSKILKIPMDNLDNIDEKTKNLTNKTLFL